MARPKRSAGGAAGAAGSAKKKTDPPRRRKRQLARRDVEQDQFVYYDKVIDSNEEKKTSTVHIPFPVEKHIDVRTSDIPTYMFEDKYKKHFAPLTVEQWRDYKNSEEFKDPKKYFLQENDKENFLDKTNDEIMDYLHKLPTHIASGSREY